MIATLSDLAEAFPGKAFFEAPACPICASLGKVRHSAFNINPDKTHAFDLRICPQCSHGWIDPMPSQQLLNYLYSRGSLSVIGEWGPTPTVPEQMCAARELTRLPMRYFELGVGRGTLYQQFLASGWQCMGVDPGAWSSANPNVFKDLSEVPSGTEADLLVAFDVLEHLADPISALRMLRKIAAPNARLYCAMPNRESLRAMYYRETWRMLRPLGHVNYFSRKSVKRAIQAAGFEVELLKATDLWQVRIPRNFSHLILNLVELLSLGDQWIVVAHTSSNSLLTVPGQT